LRTELARALERIKELTSENQREVTPQSQLQAAAKARVVVEAQLVQLGVEAEANGSAAAAEQSALEQERLAAEAAVAAALSEKSARLRSDELLLWRVASKLRRPRRRSESRNCWSSGTRGLCGAGG
jgi:hypothetical protein